MSDFITGTIVECCIFLSFSQHCVLLHLDKRMLVLTKEFTLCLRKGGSQDHRGFSLRSSVPVVGKSRNL